MERSFASMSTSIARLLLSCGGTKNGPPLERSRRAPSCRRHSEAFRQRAVCVVARPPRGVAMKLNRRIVLARRPVGEVQAEDLRYVEEPLPVPNDDQILVRNLYISLDPATRGWMDDKASYMKPIPIDGVMLSAGLA